MLNNLISTINEVLLLLVLFYCIFISILLNTENKTHVHFQIYHCADGMKIGDGCNKYN